MSYFFAGEAYAQRQFLTVDLLQCIPTSRHPPPCCPRSAKQAPGGMRAKQRRGDLQLPLCTCSKTGQEKLSRPWDDFWRWPSSDRQARWQKLGRGGAQGYLPSPMSLVHGPKSVKQAEGPTSGGGWFRFRPAPPPPPMPLATSSQTGREANFRGGQDQANSRGGPPTPLVYFAS